MPTSFNYDFTIGTGTVHLDVAVDTPAVDSTKFGPGYAINAIMGTYLDQMVTGLVGPGGTVSEDEIENTIDNTIFIGDSYGYAFQGSGSRYGVDFNGFEFATASNKYNIYLSSAGTFAVVDLALMKSFSLVLLSSNAPCYCPGTLIATPGGERPVETLAEGDLVVTASGAARPVRWVGRRAYAGRFLARSPGVQPVRIRAGALGGGLPRRDLLVSPEHALFLGGVLVPAGAVVNGDTITAERGLPRVEYVHIELDSHDLLLAEGAPAESYEDDGGRHQFGNAAEWFGRHGGQPLPAPSFCARRVTDGPELEAVRRLLRPARAA